MSAYSCRTVCATIWLTFLTSSSVARAERMVCVCLSFVFGPLELWLTALAFSAVLPYLLFPSPLAGKKAGRVTLQRGKVFPQVLCVAGFFPVLYPYSTTESGQQLVQPAFPHNRCHEMYSANKNLIRKSLDGFCRDGKCNGNSSLPRSQSASSGIASLRGLVTPAAHCSHAATYAVRRHSRVRMSAVGKAGECNSAAPNFRAPNCPLEVRGLQCGRSRAADCRVGAPGCASATIETKTSTNWETVFA